MLVAEGIAEIACDPQVSLWDLAPMKLIVDEAGGRFTDLSAASDYRRTAAAGWPPTVTLHDAVLAIIGR